MYDWGSESYQKFGATLDETLDELNDETFGTASEDVGKDLLQSDSLSCIK